MDSDPEDVADEGFVLMDSGRIFMKKLVLVFVSLLMLPGVSEAALKVPNVFGDHMVVQQKMPIKVWGWTNPGQEVSVEFGGKTVAGKAGADGRFDVALPAAEANAQPQTLTIRADETVTFNDVLVGEVWVCSGQSNMQWSVNLSNDPDLEKLAAKYPQLRMINFPQIGSQEPILTHDRRWQVCTPENVGGFSAVGYFFGRQLHQTLDIPVGMINNAWGGSAAEAWVNRDVLKADSRYQPLMTRWEQMEADFAALKAGTDLNDDEKKKLQGLTGSMGGNARPGNIYNGVLKSHLGYTIRGAIWYQGESNAGRAYQYRDLFPLMISNWRLPQRSWGRSSERQRDREGAGERGTRVLLGRR
jgi:sialate O-acetylesterase